VQRERVLVAQYRSFCHTEQHKADLAALWRRVRAARDACNAEYAVAATACDALPSTDRIPTPFLALLANSHRQCLTRTGTAGQAVATGGCAAQATLLREVRGLGTHSWARAMLGASAVRSAAAAAAVERLLDVQRAEIHAAASLTTATLCLPSATNACVACSSSMASAWRRWRLTRCSVGGCSQAA
jgi:hypothetical protein